MLTVGLKGTAETTVSGSNTAKTMGSGTLDVFATPSMLALMESASCLCVSDALSAEQSTVGTQLNVKHLSATPLGMRVTAEAELSEVDGRRLVFSVRAFDEAGLIGEGTHERFVVFAEKFMEKTNSKKG